MDGERFDQISRALATGSRRRLLRALASGALGAALAGRQRPARADHCQTGSHCGATRPGRTAPCCNSSQICCTNGAGDGICCDAATHECASPCACVPKGATCCCGGDANCTICPQGTFCCRLDSRNETCCGGGRQPLCDPTFSCRDACPEGREQCGDVCCREGQRCDTTNNFCTECPDTTVECGVECCLLGVEECCNKGTAEEGCASILFDTENCGGCNKVCRVGSKCCSGKCANLENDERNCGRCGRRCKRGKRCRKGRCRR